MSEQIANQEFREKIEKFRLYYNAQYAYREFVDLFCDSKSILDNKKLENSKVMKVIDFSIENDRELKNTLPSKTVFYRARVVRNIKEELGNVSAEEDYLNGFDYYGSKEPHCLAGASGRCNAGGTSYLYGAEDELTACAEVKPEYSDIISLGKFSLKSPMNMIDFANDRTLKELRKCETEYDVGVAPLITLIMLQYAKNSGSAIGYQVCQYVTDHFRKAGYDGIIYRSSQTDHKCYVFFKSHRRFIDLMESELVYSGRKSYAFARLKKANEAQHDEAPTGDGMGVWIDNNAPRTKLEYLLEIKDMIKKARQAK